MDSQGNESVPIVPSGVVTGDWNTPMYKVKLFSALERHRVTRNLCRQFTSGINSGTVENGFGFGEPLLRGESKNPKSSDQ